MKRELLISIAAQGILSGLLCALGSYVALQVTENNVSWIEHIQTNHELRIEALEVRAFRADARVGLLYEHKAPAQRQRGALAFKVGKPLTLERPGVEHARGPFDAFRGIKPMAHQAPTAPVFRYFGQLTLQFQAQRERRHGRDPPAATPAPGGILVDGQLH